MIITYVGRCLTISKFKKAMKVLMKSAYAPLKFQMMLMFFRFKELHQIHVSMKSHFQKIDKLQYIAIVPSRLKNDSVQMLWTSKKNVPKIEKLCTFQ